MATPKRPTKRQTEKQQYRRVTSGSGNKTSQANASVLALPAAGYGIAQLLEGLGSMSLPSISLPSISAPAAAMAAPVALTLAGPAYGLYEIITGQHHQANITPQERQAMTYAPDATRVSRPIVVSRTRVGSQSQSRPIGEMYINPALTRTRSVSMASEAADDSATPQGSAQSTTGTTQGTQPQNDQPNEERPKNGGKNSSGQEIKESAKRNLDRIKRGYTKMGKGLVNTALYAIGSSPITVPAGIWTYNTFFKKELTPMDSLLSEQGAEYEELIKAKQAKEGQARNDSLRNAIFNPRQGVRDSSIIESGSGRSQVSIGDYVFTPELPNNTK